MDIDISLLKESMGKMINREKILLSLLLAATIILTSLNPVFAGISMNVGYDDEIEYINSWKVDFGSYYNYMKKSYDDPWPEEPWPEEPLSDDTIYLTTVVETWGEKRPAVIRGNFPGITSISVDVVDIEELTTDVEIHVGAESFYTDDERPKSDNSTEVRIHTDGKASVRVIIEGDGDNPSGMKETVLSSNGIGENTVSVSTEYGIITGTVSKTENDLTVYRFDYKNLLQEMINRNEPAMPETRTGFMENLPDCSISYNSLISSSAFFGVNKKNCRKIFGDVIVSLNGISYVATDLKFIKYSYWGEGRIYYSFFLQIKKIERATLDADGKAVLIDSSTLSKEERKYDKKLLKLLKKATKPYKEEPGEIYKAGVMEVFLYRYQLTGNMGNGDYQYSVVKSNDSKGAITVKFNVNGKTASAKHGKRQREAEVLTDQIVVSYDGLFFVDTARLYGYIFT